MVRPLARQPDAHHRIRFGYVGSLLSYKGVDVLVRAMARLDAAGAVLHVYGDFKPDADPYHAELRDLAAAAPPGVVVFHGRFDNRRIADVYETIDVLVVPSTSFENSPITIHEAFLFRTPVVTSNIGGMAELVRDGVDGLLFETGSVERLAAALRRFVAEPGLVEQLSTPRPVKTMGEDVREMETRYRALACIVREKTEVRTAERAGWAMAARGGAVERQGHEFALMRPGAWIDTTSPPRTRPA